MDEITVNKVMSLGRPRVLLVGDLMLDMYVYGDADRISPEAPVPVLRVVKREYRCGGAASVAAALSALGAQPVCVGAIGKDDYGDRLVAMLHGQGADTTGLLRVDGRPTTTKQRLVGLAQHRHQQQLMRVDDECNLPLLPEAVQAILQACQRLIPSVDVVCLQDYRKGVLDEQVSKAILAMARQAHKPVLVDPARDVDYEKYRGATLITPNRFEASQAAGFAVESADDARRAAATLRNVLDLEAVVITLDRDGAFLQTADVSELVPTRARTVYDVTGAGDVVLAALAVGLAAGWDQLAAVQLANLAAGIAVGKFGTATATVDEILHELHFQNAGQAGKVLLLDPLLQVLKWHRNRGKSIVFTNGCFDVLHEGHVNCLNYCKRQGDLVVVGLNSDASVRQLKGPQRPINSQHDRAAVLAALEAVDYIVIFDDPSVLDLVKTVRPNVLVKGGDCKDRDIGVVGREFVESYGGRVLLAPLVQGRSTTATIAKIRSQET